MQFTLFMGLLIENSKFADKICTKYLIYIKEINDYVNNSLNKNEINKKNGKENSIEEESEEYLLILKGYIYYFGFKGIEQQNLQKAVEYIDKGIYMTKEMHSKKTNEFIKYNILLQMNNLKLISNEELINKKKKLIDFFSKNLNLKYQTVDCYIIGEDYFEGIIKHKDEFVGLMIYKYGQNILCKTIYDCQLKSKIKKFLKNHDNKYENKLKDETCSICYDKKVNKTLIPCKHNLCSFCVDKFDKDSKCPFCRSEILFII